MQLELHVCQCLTFLFDFHWVIILWQLHLTPFDSLTSSWLRSLKLSDAVECRTFSSNCLHLQVFVFWARKNRKFFGFGPTKKAKKRIEVAIDYIRYPVLQFAQYVARSSRHSRFGTSMQTFSADGSLNVCYSAACILHRIQAIALVIPMQCAADGKHMPTPRNPHLVNFGRFSFAPKFHVTICWGLSICDAKEHHTEEQRVWYPASERSFTAVTAEKQNCLQLTFPGSWRKSSAILWAAKRSRTCSTILSLWT